MKAVPTNRYVVFFSVATLGCLIDLVTKHWVFDWLGGPGESPPRWIWQNVAGFQTSLNEGALFGMGQGWVHAFSAVSVVAAVAIFYYLFCRGVAHDLWLTVALGSITAGVFGNLYDRLGMPGLRWKDPWIVYDLHRVGEPVYAVRDWIHVIIIKWPWPNFNVADSMLVCGAGLLAWHVLRHGDPRGQTTPTAVEKGSEPVSPAPKGCCRAENR
jgi:signal peptidase II